MNKERSKIGVGIILAFFIIMYIGFTAASTYYAFTLKEATDPYGTAAATLRMAAVIMCIAAASFLALTIFWNIKAHKGFGPKDSNRFFGWLCANAIVMFFLPPALTWDTTNMFQGPLSFMAFTPVLAPVVMMIAAAVVMLDIIKQKNGGTLRKRR